jgi:multicomponent K+:H+ antiporter subunit A
MLLPITAMGLSIGSLGLTVPDVPTTVAAGILIVSALGAAAAHRARLVSLILLSVVGLMVALAFARFSAPDLAMTQLSVEVVTIILLLLALYYLPSWTPREASRFRQWRDIGIAAAAGTGMFLITLAMLTRPFESISDFFLEHSKSGGGGTNVVNVILVDFRGFDTLGEITVLAIAALGIFAMLRETRLQAPTTDGQGHPWTHDAHPTMLREISRPLLPLALMVCIFLFLRGHNLPGGGFIAGLITAIALILQYVGSGMHWSHQRIRLQHQTPLALGLSFAVITGLGSFAFDYPFLTSTFAHIKWPVVGEFELASAMAFDIGVYLTVVGATLMIMASLGRLSMQSGDPAEKT